jgi:SAM-dependent methyltransferase
MRVSAALGAAETRIYRLHANGARSELYYQDRSPQANKDGRFTMQQNMLQRSLFFYAAGIIFLFLAKVQNLLRGYTSPKPFDTSETTRCIEYDIHVVEHWLSYLQQYTGGTDSWVGKNVLELGPGSDLGIGIYLLAKGCAQYNACDVNNLMAATPDHFYEQFFEKLASVNVQTDLDVLKQELRKSKDKSSDSRLNYVVREDFDFVSAFGKETIDLVFSQAAFEHFDDIEATIAQIGTVCKPGAILVTEIDLKTHSRWIRDKDPNNIYRYPNALYKLFWFRGIPNRIRPFEYQKAFEQSGWTDIAIIPLDTLKENDHGRVGLSRSFADETNQMDYLSVILCARKPKIEG